MARMPGAVWRPIDSAYRSESALDADILCLHTIVGGGQGTWNYFNTGAGGRHVWSHLLVDGKWSSADVDGRITQCGDTAYRAAANLNGNPYIISVETADNAARPIAPWTPAQEAAIISIMVWAHRAHGIPLVLVPDSKRGRRGIAYHKLGCDPFRAAGADLWSSAYGKDCPTDARYSRIPALIARAVAIVNGGTVPPTIQEDDLPYTEAQLRGIIASEVERVTIRTMLAIVTGQTNSVVNAADIADLPNLSVRGQLGALAALLMYGDSRDAESGDAKDTHPDNLQRIRGTLDRLALNVAKEAVNPAELAAALKTAMTDLPEADLSDETIQRIAQSTATLLHPVNTDPTDPAGV